MKAAPFAGMLLAALGAEVTLVEDGASSVTRTMGPHLDSVPSPDTSAAFNMVNRGKNAVCIDLKGSQGRAELQKLVAASDVVLENFSDSGAEYLGITLEALRQANPRIVLGSIRGFGRDSRWERWLALHSTVISLSGLGSRTLDLLGRPRLVGSLYPDILAGSMLAYEVVRTMATHNGDGNGAEIRVDMLEVLQYAMGGLVEEGSTTGPPTSRVTEAPQQAIERDQSGSFVYVERGRPDEQVNATATTFPGRVDGEAVRVDVRSMLDVFADEHLQQRGFVLHEERDDLQGVRVPAVPWLADGRRPVLSGAPKAPQRA